MRSIAVILVTLLFLVASAPVRAEEPEEDPYYVRVDTHPPQGPGPYEGQRDCTRKADRDRSTLTLNPSQPGTGFHPAPPVNERGGPSLANTTPRCVAFDLSSDILCIPVLCVAPHVAAHGTYNVTSGDYALLLSLPFETRSSAAGLSGNSGIGIAFDCEGCPPPGG